MYSNDLVFPEGNIPVSPELAKKEHDVLKYWRKIDAFKTSLELSKHNKPYIFYDGPPFATGLPHYGHILAGTVKDLIARYATMNGHYVQRKFGWDTHGLPIEHIIDKKLNIKNKSDLKAYGIAKYNEDCRSIVMECADQWELIVERLGRWVDFKNGYKTMDLNFMESVWWCFKKLYDKGAVYRSYKVMPYSTGVHTTISNFELSLNYNEINDPSIIVSFPLINDTGVSLIAWTTTPWTLVTNLALCVNPSKTYVKFKDLETGAKYIIMECRLQYFYNMDPSSKCEILDRFPGSDLEGLKYKPIFNLINDRYEDRAFKILCSEEAVTTDVGTGIVQMAPAHGEVDFKICLENKIFDHDDQLNEHFDDSGIFKDVIKPYRGLYFKDADKCIIKDIKKLGRLIRNATIRHSYPFCWRSNTPIMYIAVSCWLVKVSEITDKLVKNLSQTRWVPDYVGSKRFLNWVANAKDWNISRERYWGTPIPLWVSDDNEEIVAVGSIEELNELSGCGPITDIHPHNIENIKIPSKMGKGMLSRVNYVFDCWFESGSMPYSEYHYPFENADKFHERFPADFISEGIDQTRGWFYTLLVLSTHLSDISSFKNVVVVGHILAEDGKKMSKSKGNYPDPLKVVEKYGADVLRVFLVNSPVLYGESLRFSENGLKETYSKTFSPWYNSLRFFSNQVGLLKKIYNHDFSYNPNIELSEGNYLDRWILSETQTLLKKVKHEMDNYKLYNAIPLFDGCVNNTANWYIRLNRRRLKGENGLKQAVFSLNALFKVLYDFCLIMAPTTPFFSEIVYQNLKQYLRTCINNLDLKTCDSVHYLRYPEVDESLIHPDAERAVSCLKDVINTGRLLREKYGISFKKPCNELIVLVNDDISKNDIESLSKYVLDEMNVKKLTLSTDKNNYNIKYRLEPNYKVIGNSHRSKVPEIKKLLGSLTPEEIQKFIETDKLDIGEYSFTNNDVLVLHSIENTSPNIKIQYNKKVITMLDTTPSEELSNEGYMRDLINQIQKLRKKINLTPTDDVFYRYAITQGSQKHMDEILADHKNYFKNVLRCDILPYDENSDAENEILTFEDQKIADIEYKMYFLKV